ncbi:MAG TPA: galactokinase [Myxococcota bacterium]|nr:galactokinase [Myxococcota bacterium]
MSDVVLRAAVRGLREAFGRSPELAVRAPGRVNLIGEHTDYNGGLVLPCAIDRATVAVAARRSDSRLRVHSTALGAAGEIEPGRAARGRGWLDYVTGVAWAFQREGLPVAGLDVALASDLPRESGLSSSAALEVAMATLLDAAAGVGLDAAERARLAWRAECEFVGVPCGRMDQLASALGQRDAALRIDCRDFSARVVPLPSDRLALLVVDSGVRRRLADGDYGARRRECEEALAQARARGVVPPDAGSWRDVEPGRLADLERRLDSTLARRARHVLTENERVDAMAEALAAGDLARAGALVREGMASLRDDFEVSVPELDALCAFGDATPGCYGSRLTGAGFGGCTLHLVAPERADAVAAAIRAGFAARFDREPPVLAVRAAEGASTISLPPGQVDRLG